MVLGININLMAVFVAAITSMVIGSLWYGPLFGKEWMRLSGLGKKETLDKMKKKGMNKAYILTFVSSLVTAYILSLFITLAGADTAVLGMIVAFLAWFGFVATEAIGGVLWEGKSMEMFWIKSLGSLITLLVMSAILAVW
jgi:hypothetical protein